MRKPIPNYLTFRQALKRGYAGRMEDGAYLGWVRTLPCVSCDSGGSDPHHPIDVGYKGGATKVPDYWCFPLCRNCHDALHHNPAGWEEVNGLQLEHAVVTMTQAIYEGRLSFE